MMKIIYVLSFALIIVSCGTGSTQKKSSASIPSGKEFVSTHKGACITKDIYTNIEIGDMIMDTVNSYFIPDGLRPTTVAKYNKDSNRNVAIKTFNVRIVADDSLNGKIGVEGWDFKWTNTILEKLNTGIRLYNVDSVEYFNLDSMNTGGRVNTDIVISELRNIIGGDKSDIVIGLYNDTEFFNTANAIAINHGKEDEKMHYIFGDGQLLLSPMILIHELGHSLGLTHSNEVIGGEYCNMFNIMHESNIGCVLGFNARQLLLMNGDEYVVELNNRSNRYYPVDNRNCECDSLDTLAGGRYNTEFQKYLNSIDRNIDDTPLIGDLSYMDNINIDDLGVENDLKYLYKKEFDKFFGNAGDEATYVDMRWNAHKKLRANNMARLIIETAREMSIYDSVSVADVVASLNGDVNVRGDSILIQIDKRIDCKSPASCELALDCVMREKERVMREKENLKEKLESVSEILRRRENEDGSSNNTNVSSLVDETIRLIEILNSQGLSKENKELQMQMQKTLVEIEDVNPKK